MTRFYAFSNPEAKSYIESFGYRCSMLQSTHEKLRKAVALAVRKPADLEKASSFIDTLSSRYTVYIIFLDERNEDSDELVSSPSGAYLSGKETAFLYHFLNDDVVKKTLTELDMSRSGYYKMLKRILGKLDIESAGQLKMWALLHLSL